MKSMPAETLAEVHTRARAAKRRRARRELYRALAGIAIMTGTLLGVAIFNDAPLSLPELATLALLGVITVVTLTRQALGAALALLDARPTDEPDPRDLRRTAPPLC